MLILMRFSGCGACCLTRDHHSTVRPDKDRGWRGTTGQLARKSLMSEKCSRAVAGVAGCSQPQILDKTMSNRKHLVFAEVEKLLAATMGTRNETRDRCLLLLMFRAGLRVSETCGYNCPKWIPAACARQAAERRTIYHAPAPMTRYALSRHG